MDPILIEQVITNLLENVVYHAQAAKVRLNLRKENHHAVFEIMDDGVGIPQKKMPTLFEMTASQTGVSDGTRGMGIGLSVCKAIILAHGGKIEAENNPEGGACFRFYLPMKEEHHEFHDDHSDR